MIVIAAAQFPGPPMLLLAMVLIPPLMEAVGPADSVQVFGHKGVQVKSLAYGINDVPISSNAAFNPLSVLIFSRNRLRSRLTAV
jgi:hypothetical protein